MHFGIISPPVPGHLHPFGALGRELIERGHRVSLIHMPDLERQAHREGLEFVGIGHADHPAGSLPESLAQLGRRKGNAALRFTIDAVANTTAMMLRDAPEVIRSAGISMLLVDQMEPAGGTIAEHLDLPFVTVCNALALNREPDIPPAFTPWGFTGRLPARIRNRIGYAVADRFTSAISEAVNQYRRLWGLPKHSTPDDSFSNLAQISQLPKAFDYPRRALPETFHYVGPLRKAEIAPTPFPWERLDGRPLIYASLGTLQNSRAPVFQAFAEACEGLHAQLVITHGGGLSQREAEALSEKAVVVAYAPQLDLLSRASLTLTHAGLNTVLDSLTFGVPIIAIPITYEQPAIAERLRYAGAGEIISLNQLSAGKLRPVIAKVLSEPAYRRKAQEVAQSIRDSGGVARAASIVLACARANSSGAGSV